MRGDKLWSIQNQKYIYGTTVDVWLAQFTSRIWNNLFQWLFSVMVTMEAERILLIAVNIWLKKVFLLFVWTFVAVLEKAEARENYRDDYIF